MYLWQGRREKYGRDGHLFKERFKSEPVNDMSYFTTLLRYIHQNPVKAGIVEHVREYEFSSWGEYDGSVDSVFQICDTATVLRRKPYEQLNDLMNEMLPVCFVEKKLRCKNTKKSRTAKVIRELFLIFVKKAVGKSPL